MKSKVTLLTLLACTFVAQARPVMDTEAAAAVRGWVADGRHLGAWLNGGVDDVTRHETDSGSVFYAVKLSGNGTVFTSGDTRIRPIIAFTSASTDFSTIDPASPLWVLLNRDLSAREENTESVSNLSFGPTALAAKSAQVADANEGAWEKLIAAGGTTSSSSTLSFGLCAASELSSEPTDLRVDHLMQTQWSQSGGIWNYYTPEHAVCGCVATAAAQVMRYLHGTPDEDGKGGLEIPFPKASVEQRKFACSYRNSPLELTLQGGTYAWTNMPFTTSEIKTEVQKQNIGKLVSDVGISVNMAYEMDESGSGAVNSDVPGRLMDVFGYRQAIWMDLGAGNDSADDSECVQQSLYANFDAGRPCLMSIPGHAIVADGYGYEEDVAYVHLNMGWAGSADFWYNLPDMTAAGSKYTVVNGVAYNIFPDVGGVDEAGLTTVAILSGRILDDDGNPVEGCAVTVESAGEVVTNLVSGAHGIWSAFLAPGTYDVTAATDDGEWIGTAEGLVLEVPATSPAEEGASIMAVPASVGNCWGNDITLEHPSVRITGEARPYSTIDRAVAAARKIYAANPTLPAIELQVIDNTQLKATQTIDFPCVIVATNDDPYASLVVRREGAALAVATNGFLAVSNVVFTGVNETLVSVASNGVVTVAGLVDFGVSYETAAIETAATNGFLLASPIDLGFTLKCDAARVVGEFCGIGAATTMPVFKAITNCAAKIANFYDPQGEIRAHVVGGPNDYSLVWADQPVPVEESVGFFIDATGATNTAARLDKLVEDYEKALRDGKLGTVRRLVIRKSGTLSRPLTISDGLTVTSEGEPVINLEGTAGFTVTGGKMSVSGLTFTNYVGNALFLVNGETAELEIGGHTVFTQITGTNRWSGALTVLKGAAAVGGGTRFDGCAASGKYAANRNPINAYGGAVYLDAGCTLALSDCTITNSTAKNYGGAVYAETGSVVRLSGELHVVGNVSGDSRRDDVYLKNSDKGSAALVLAGAVSGSVGIRRQGSYDGFGNASGEWLATAENAVYSHESTLAFVNDAATSRVAEAVDEDGVFALRWTETPVGPQPWTGDPSLASARVTYAAGGEPVYYLLVSEALRALEADATVEIIGWDGCYIESDLTLTNCVTLKSDTEVGTYWFERRGNCSITIGANASLALQDVTIRGCEMTNSLETVGVMLRAKPDESTSVPVFNVAGGTLTLMTPSDTDQYETAIEHVYGNGGRAAGAVHVTAGGVLTLARGASIRQCFNETVNEADGTGRGGAVLVEEEGVANLTGGTITNCRANHGGGVFVGSHATVRVSGDCFIRGNSNLSAEDDDVYISDNANLVLSDTLTGQIGVTGGVMADPVVFGLVSSDFAGTPAAAVASAHKFTNNRTGDIGLVATNATDRLLVWGSSLAEDGTHTDEDGEVSAIEDGEAYQIAVPTGASLVYDGTEQDGVPAAIGCLVSGNKATNAGSYSATVTLRPGFAWTDGTSDAKTVAWSIAKATYDIANDLYKDGVFTYGGKEYELVISGELPAGVTVTYLNNRRTELGEQIATAVFSGDEDNYEPIPNQTATLKIVSLPDDPPIPPETEELQYAEPGPIAVKSISRVSETEWTLVVTNRVKWAQYRLLWTADLSKGFTATGAWEQATTAGEWTTNITISAPVPAAIFWQAEGQKGLIPNE